MLQFAVLVMLYFDVKIVRLMGHVVVICQKMKPLDS